MGSFGNSGQCDCNQAGHWLTVLTGGGDGLQHIHQTVSG